MRQRHLKILRLVLALFFILSIGFIFLDFRELFPDGLYTGITFLQFVPSIIKFLTTFGLVSAGFIAVVLLTSLFGRVYCSAICPLGILQDLVSRVRKMTRKKKLRYRYGKPHNFWRYSLLALPLIILIAGQSLAGINLLDPYSIFGRIFSDLGQPVYITANNLLARLFEKADLYILYPEDITSGRALSYLIPSLMLAVVVWFSFRHGRLYCNAVCPVGTLLGLLSRVSVFRIKMIESRCTKCARCVFACKASCIDMKNLEVDFSRCVGCFNCLQVCPEDAIRLVGPGNRSTSAPDAGPPENSESRALHSRGRREAVIRMLATGLALAGISHRAAARFQEREAGSATGDGSEPGQSDTGKQAGAGTQPGTGTRAGTGTQAGTGTRAGTGTQARAGTQPGEGNGSLKGDTSALPKNVENKIPTEIAPVKHFPVSPPGSLGLRHFTGRCTACHLCISACPTGVLQPSLTEYGLDGILQPHMDYSTNYCNFQCVLCSEVCPTGAILSLTEEAKKTTQLGQVHLILENCVVYAENTACGSCSEHCPTQAVTMVPYREGLTLPRIKPAICVGCGACEYACPVRPHKAIYVDGHEIHQVAEKPPVEELEKTEMEDFPF
jgi:ferredoxin